MWVATPAPPAHQSCYAHHATTLCSLGGEGVACRERVEKRKMAHIYGQLSAVFVQVAHIVLGMRGPLAQPLTVHHLRVCGRPGGAFSSSSSSCGRVGVRGPGDRVKKDCRYKRGGNSVDPSLILVSLFWLRYPFYRPFMENRSFGAPVVACAPSSRRSRPRPSYMQNRWQQSCRWLGG